MILEPVTPADELHESLMAQGRYDEARAVQQKQRADDRRRRIRTFATWVAVIVLVLTVLALMSWAIDVLHDCNGC